MLSECINKGKEESSAVQEIKLPSFSGSQVCGNCHNTIYQSHLHTAHYLTSTPARVEFIKGSFEPGKNSFAFNAFVKVVMEKRDQKFYQVEYNNGQERTARPFDIVFGSGSRGQTYLYWNRNRIFQLPIFYFTAEDEWCNSPGYPGKVIFNRPITSRCLECHTTYVEKTSGPEKAVEEFNPDGIVLGVDCEKCHGNAGSHVVYHQQHPTDSTARYILNPAKFTRQRQLELCRLCHGGRLNKTRPSFSYQPGDTLADYFQIDTSAINAANIDVHGNQYGLLSVSKCFRMSGMTCTTCHDPHENQRNQAAYFSQRCISCHNPGHGITCTIGKKPGLVIERNCVDCHMPEQPSKAIVFLEQGQSVPKVASMRSHDIRVYPEETQKFLDQLKPGKKKPGSGH